MTPAHRTPALAFAAALLAAPGTAAAADQAGAAALQADFQEFFAELDASYGLVATPSAPVRVTVKDDSYLVDIAAFTLDLSGHTGGADAVLAVAASSLRLTPDPADSDRTGYQLVTAPTVTLTVDGLEAARIGFDSFASEGVWSDALDMAVSDVTRIEGLAITLDTAALRLPSLDLVGSAFSVRAAVLESETVAVPEGADTWTLRNRMRAEDIASWGGETVGGEAVLLRSAAVMTSDTRMTGVPLAAWRDYLADWLPVLVAAELSGTPPTRDQMVALVTELPAWFASASFTAGETDSVYSGFTIAETADSLTLTRNADGALDLDWHTESSGMGLAPGTEPWGMPVPAALSGMLPNHYQATMAVAGLPVAQTWQAMVDTVDAWIDDPDAAGEVFIRTFAARAAALGTSGTLTMSADWPDSRFGLDAALAAGRQAELGVSGTVDAAVTNMQAFSDAFVASDLPEVASFLVILQALGQREEPADGAAAVTRYTLALAEDGTITFNNRDFGPVLRMIEEFFGAFQLGPTDPLPQP